MKYLLNEPSRQEPVDLLPDGSVLLLVESAQALLQRLAFDLDV